jgi:hypothetical protein
MGLADIITQDLERMLNKIAEEQTKENKTMTTRKEAFMKSAEELYKFIEDNHQEACTINLKLWVPIRPGCQQVSWHLPNYSLNIAANYDVPRPCPKAGTPMLGWNDDKARAVVGVATGAVAPREDGSRLIEMRVGNSDHLVGNWSILKEVEETP